MDPWATFPGSFIPLSFNRQLPAYTYGHAPTPNPHVINESALHGVPLAHPTAYQPGALHLPNPLQGAVRRKATLISDAELTATPMGPPPKRRKKKAPTLRAKDWEPYKARIFELRDEHKMPLPKVKTVIEQEFGFTAELRQYRTRISQWGKDKNIKSREMSAMARKRQQRKLVEVDKREQTFTVRGRDVEPHKIDRWMVRNGVSQTSLYAPSPAASTPSAVGCRTISERGSVASSPAYSIANLDFSPRDITSIVSSPAAPSPMPSVGEIAYLHNTTAFTGQSPAPINQPPATHSSISHSAISNAVSDEQLPRCYRQDDEDRIREALSVAEDFLGASHCGTLQLRIELGRVLLSQGKYKSAEETARRAMEDCRRHGSIDVIMIDAKDLLVGILRHQGSVHQAQKLAESAFESSEATPGEEHLFALHSMNNLSCEYLENRRFKDAEDLCAQAIKISKIIVGERHTKTLELMTTLSIIYIEQKQLSDAEKLLSQVLQISTELLGRDHEFTTEVVAIVVHLYRLQERWKDAEELLVQTVKTSILLVGEEHLATLEYQLKLAAIYAEQGQYKKAENIGERLLVVRRKVYGEQHPKTLDSMSYMVHTYMGQRRFKEAEDLGVQLLIAMKRVLGEQHPETLHTADLMEEIYEAQEDSSEGEGSEDVIA